MSKLNVEGYLKLMEGISGNLKNEIEELSKKVEQARESENWGTYKNLILAYKEIVKMYNDIIIDVCERDIDKTQHIETTISLDKKTSDMVFKVAEGIFTNNSTMTANGLIIKPKQNATKIVNLFDEWDMIKSELQDGSMTMNINTSKLLSRKLSPSLTGEGTLINVKGFRGIGKTYELIKFAKHWNYIVVVPNEFMANEFRKEYDYNYIYSQKSNLLNGIELKDCVVDEGVDIEKIKELGLNIVTGYIRK